MGRGFEDSSNPRRLLTQWRHWANIMKSSFINPVSWESFCG